MKILRVTVLVLILCMSLILCGCFSTVSDKEIIGKWKMTSMKIKMEGVNGNDATSYDSSEDNVNYVFSQDGTGTFNFDSYSYDITWKINGNNVEVTNAEGGNVNLKYKGGKLIVEEKDEDITNISTFEKQ